MPKQNGWYLDGKYYTSSIPIFVSDGLIFFCNKIQHCPYTEYTGGSTDLLRSWSQTGQSWGRSSRGMYRNTPAAQNADNLTLIFQWQCAGNGSKSAVPFLRLLRGRLRHMWRAFGARGQHHPSWHSPYPTEYLPSLQMCLCANVREAREKILHFLFLRWFTLVTFQTYFWFPSPRPGGGDIWRLGRRAACCLFWD